MNRSYMSRLAGGVAAAAMALATTAAPVQAQHKAPNTQPATAAADEAALPAGTTSLGTVRLSRAVKANGEMLAAGTYQVRLTEQKAPPATGATTGYERWIEFVRGGEVRGREVVSIVPQSEIAQVTKGAAPARLDWLTRWWKVALLVTLITIGLPLAHAMFGEVVALLGGAVLFGFLLGRWTAGV